MGKRSRFMGHVAHMSCSKYRRCRGKNVFQEPLACREKRLTGSTSQEIPLHKRHCIKKSLPVSTEFPARALILYSVNNVVTYREISRTGRETTEIGQSRLVTTELHKRKHCFCSSSSKNQYFLGKHLKAYV